jgi:hypothetical protein
MRKRDGYRDHRVANLILSVAQQRISKEGQTRGRDALLRKAPYTKPSQAEHGLCAGLGG